MTDKDARHVPREIPRLALGLWLIGCVLALFARIDVVLTSMAISVWSLICYWATVSRTRSKSPSDERRALFARFLAPFAIILLSFFAVRTYFWITWDPIGSPYDTGWGLAPFPNRASETSTKSNGRGIFATCLRMTSGMLDADAPASYYIFIHSAGTNEDHGNLVFRYYATEEGFYDSPSFVWLTPSTIKIMVPNGDVQQITKQRSSLGGVHILYSVGQSVEQPALRFWERPFF